MIDKNKLKTVSRLACLVRWFSFDVWKDDKEKKNQRINYRFVLPPPPSPFPSLRFPFSLPPFLPSFVHGTGIFEYNASTAWSPPLVRDDIVARRATWKGLRLTIRPRIFSRRGFVSIIRKKYYYWSRESENYPLSIESYNQHNLSSLWCL